MPIAEMTGPFRYSRDSSCIGDGSNEAWDCLFTASAAALASPAGTCTRAQVAHKNASAPSRRSYSTNCEGML